MPVSRLKELLPHPSMFLAWVIIGAACFGTWSIYQRISPTLDRSTLYPAKSDRYDITSLNIGLTQDVCPTLASIDSDRAFEECLRTSRDPSAYVTVTVPDIDAILEGHPPRFLDQLALQGNKTIAAAIRKKSPYVIHIRVPSNYFSGTKLVENRHVLLFHAMLNGIVCVDGICTQEINKYTPEHRGVVLVRKGAQETSDALYSDIHIFAVDTPYPLGISLMSGIFVTAQSRLLSIYRNGPVIKQGKSLIFIAIFAGLVLAAFIYCLASGFLDYAALAFLAFAMSLFIVGEQYGLFADMDKIAFYRQRAFIDLNLLVAATVFAAATARAKWQWIVIGLIVIYPINWVICFVLLPSELSVLVQSWPAYTLRAANYLFWVPPGICLAGAVNCLFLAGEAKRNKLGQSTINDFLRRGLLEQPVYTLVLGYFGYHALQMAALRETGLLSEQFVPTAALTFFALFSVMVVNSLIRHKMALQNANDLSESDRVRIRVGPRGLAQFNAKQRWGAFLNIDLEGSSLATTVLGSYMHDIMSELGEAIYLSHRRAGRQWFHDTTLGDEWIIALKPIHHDPKDELKALVQLTRAHINDYLAIVKFFERAFGVTLSLHVTIMIVSNYSLGSAKEKPFDPQELKQIKQSIDPRYATAVFRRKADFLGPEINYMMKYVGKPPPYHMSIVGRSDFISTELRQLGSQAARITDLMERKGALPESIAAASPMNLEYLQLDWRQAAEATDWGDTKSEERPGHKKTA